MSDRKYMLEALELAASAWGRTSPNPMVGAVIVKDGRIIGRGCHLKAGTAHAEVNAIADCSESCKDAIIYVTLEPCSTYGRTPPCTEAILKAGLKRVVIASLDPNPAHAGRAVNILQNHGIEVVSGIEEERALELNEAFFKWITTGKPFVLLKMAMTLDGRIATRSGNSQWVTGAEARERVQILRQWADAVMIGGETARTDHPSLNVRNVADWAPQPRRLVVSRSMIQADAEKYLAPGIAPEIVSPSNTEEWHQLMQNFGKQNITAILVEGGGALAGNMLRAGVIDKVEFHIAPKILGGNNSRPVVGGSDPETLSEALNLKGVREFRLGNDFAISGYLK